MTIEKESTIFRGVVCLHCKTPIPVPAIVSDVLASSADDVELLQKKSQVFNVRCPYCLKEKPYRTREIVDFEGTPEKLMFRDRPTPMRWLPQSAMARVAKA
jgi:hypothetical protein